MSTTADVSRGNDDAGVVDDPAGRTPTVRWQLVHAQPGALVYAMPKATSPAHPLVRRSAGWLPSGSEPTAATARAADVEHPVLQYAGYIGRVGVLAAALGVGAAVAGTPGLAWAQPAGADSTTSSSTTESGPARPTSRQSGTGTQRRASDSTAHGPATGTSAVRGTAEARTGTAASPRTAAPAITAEPTTPLEQTTTTTVTDTPATSTPVAESPAVTQTDATDLAPTVTEPPADNEQQAGPADRTAPAPEPEGSDHSSTPTQAVRGSTPAGPQAQLRAARPHLQTPAELGPAAPVAPEPATETPPTVTATGEPQPAPSPAEAAPALIDRLVATALAPLTSPTAVPATQAAQTGVLYGIFAWLRRTFDNKTPTLAYNPTLNTQLDDTVTGSLHPTDADGDALTYTVSTPVNGGTVTVAPDGTFTYTATDTLAQTGGTDTFTVTATDDNAGYWHVHGLPGLINAITFGLIGNPGHTATTTVTVTIAPVNAAPVVGSPAYGFDNLDHTTGTVGGHLNVTDPDHDLLTYTLSGGPTQGHVVTLNAATGAFSYTPNPEDRHQAAAENPAPADLADQFTVTVADGHGHTVDVPVSVAIDPANNTPVMTITDITNPDEQGTVRVTVTTVDLDNDQITYLVVDNPDHGNVSYNPTIGTFAYTPTDDARHQAAATTGVDTDTFTIRASDAHGGTDTDTATVVISPTNTPPVAVNDSATTSEGAPVSGNVLTNDTDADHDTLTVVDYTQPKNGSVTLTESGAFTYTPAPDFDENDSFEYTVSDGHGGTSTANVSVTVTPVNDAPVANPDTATTDEDTPITIDVLRNDTDIEYDPLTVDDFDTRSAAGGTVALNPDGTFTYTPAANYHGTDTFTYTVTDEHLTSNPATVTVTITPVNDAPIAVDADLSTDEDTPLTGNVLDYVTDVEGDTLTASLHSDVSNGHLTFNNDGSFTYTTDENWFGTDSFTYVATDANGRDSNIATVHITVTPVNDAPTAVDDTVTTSEDTAVSITPAVSDPDPGDTLTLAATTTPDHGTVALNPDGKSFTYTPAADWSGTDTFTYQATDADGATSNTATVSVTVNNLPPTAANDETYNVNEGAVLTVDAEHGVLANDTDPGGGTLTAQWVGGPTHAAAFTLNPDGSFSYTPAPDWAGTTFFAYRAIDSQGAASDVAFVRIDTHNLVPVSTDDVDYQVDEDTTLTVDAEHGVLANDTDPGGGGLTALLRDPPAHAQAFTLNPDGSFSYSPAPDWSGVDGFTYWAIDDEGGNDIASVTVTINPVNDAPVAVDDTVTTSEDTAVSITPLGNDTDPEGALLTVDDYTQPANGTLELIFGGSFIYTPRADFTGTDTFTYTATDGTLTSDPATVTITVTPVNDAPVTVNDTATTNEDTPIVIDVLHNDDDVDSPTFWIKSHTPPANGTVVLNADGTFTYTPNPNFNGTDAFTYTATDGSLTSNPALVTVTVTSVNDAPVAHDDAVFVLEDHTVSGNVLANDTDVDSTNLTVTLEPIAGRYGPAKGSLTLEADGSFIYTPNENLGGSWDNFAYSVSDGVNRSYALVTITIGAVNDLPVAVDDSATTDEDQPISIPVLANDTDVEHDALAIANYTQPQHGTVTAVAVGALRYTPRPNYNGTDTFTYTVTDGHDGTSNQATVTVTVNPVNDAPVATDDSYTTAEDTALTVSAPGVLGNDTDVEGNPLTAAVVDAPNHGVLVLNTDGSFIYTPHGDYFGPDRFTYTASDGSATSARATVNVTVNPVNDAPYADSDDYTVDEDTTLVVAAPGVLGNDSDIEGDTLTVGTVTQPHHGTVVVNPDGSFTYTPQANYSGLDSFTYTAFGGGLPSNSAAVFIDITPVNDAPVINTVTSTPGIGNSWTVAVGASDIDSPALNIAVNPVDAEHVSVTANGNGTFTVTAEPTWAASHPGTQVLVNVVASDPDNATDQRNNQAIGTVNNAAAIGYNSSGQTNIPALPAGVTYTQLAAGASHTVLLRSDGTAVATGWNGSGQTNIPPLTGGLTYTQIAAGGNHTVLLRSDGQAVAVGDTSYGLTVIPPLTGGVTYTQVAAGANHTVLLRSDGTAVAIGSNVSGQTTIPALTGGLTYTQAAAGDAHTVLLRSDGTAIAFGDNSYGQSTIPALPTGVTYTQVAAGGYNTVLLRSDGTAIATGWNGYGQTTIPAPTGGLTYTQVAAGDAHTVLLRSDGTAIARGWNGYGQTTIPTLPAGMAYTQIAAGGGDTVLLSAAVSGRPVALADAVSTNEDTPVLISAATLLSNDTDPNSQPLRIISVSQGAHGSTSLAPGGGSITYTPNANYNGTDTFTYTITDGGLANAATVTVTVNPVNDAPVINAVTSTPGTGNTWTVAVNATDVDSAFNVTVAAVDPNVSVTNNGNGTYTITADNTWAAAHPATQVLLNVTATDTANATDVHANQAVGTINNAVAVGLNQGASWLNVPALPAGVTYTQAAAGEAHTVLLRSDGQAVGIGANGNGQINIPVLPQGMTYTQVAAAQYSTLLLRSDGAAVPLGVASSWQIAAPPAGLRYTQVSLSGDHAVLLLSDGQAVAFGNNTFGQRNIPAGTYTQVAAGEYHTVLLRADGQVVVAGRSNEGQATIPALPSGMTYTKVAAGTYHTVLLRSDGQVFAAGLGSQGQTNIPSLPTGATYVGISAGGNSTVLLRSDGVAITRGQTEVAYPPALSTGIIYTGAANGTYHTIFLRAVNTPPAINAAVSNVDPATGNVTVTVSAVDPNGGPVTLSNTTPSQGKVTLVDNHNGTWTYTYDPTDAARLRAGVSAGPDADTFAITATDGAGGSTTTPIPTVPITPANIAVTGSTQTIALGPVDIATNPNPAIPYMYLANQNTYSVPVTSTTTNGLVTTMVVPYPAYAVAVSPNGSRVYITNHDLNGFVTVRDGATTNQITVIQVSSGASYPNGVTFSADSTRAYVSLVDKKGGVGNVAVIDVANNSVLTTVTVGISPQGMAANATRLYVANSGSDTVSVINVGTNAKITDITVGDQPSSVAVSPDGTRAYVTNNAGNTVSVIDTASNTVIATVDVGSFPNDVAVSGDGSLAYVTDMNGAAVSVIDTSTNTVITNVPISGSPMAVGVTPAGNIYVGVASAPMSVLSLVTASGS